LRKNVIWKETDYGEVGYTYREIVVFAISEAGIGGITASEIEVETGLNKKTIEHYLRDLKKLNRIYSIRPPNAYGSGLNEQVWKMIYYGKR
jgi:nucleoside-diphosphate-sugar epimerase